jgi:hypothetical protein
LEIKNHVDVEKNFEFQHITSDKIEKIIDKINIKKASVIGLHCLITLAGMLSNPEAFFIFILSIIFSILSDVICWKKCQLLENC